MALAMRAFLFGKLYFTDIIFGMFNHSSLKRISLAVLQAVIDSALCWYSFYLVSDLWLAPGEPYGLTSEISAFLIGTVLAVFWFNELYDFRNWILWDELKAILKSSALIMLVAVLYLYSQKFDMSRFILLAGIVIFVPACLAARYAFRRIFFALGLLTIHIIILGAGRTGEFFAQKIHAHPLHSLQGSGLPRR